MTDQPKTWAEMTDAEKGALLLAKHRGKVIEFHNPQTRPVMGWVANDDFPIRDHIAYRVRPEPKRETLTLYVDDNGLTRNAAPLPWDATHRITFDRLDGELDPDSIKMERL